MVAGASNGLPQWRARHTLPVPAPTPQEVLAHSGLGWWKVSEMGSLGWRKHPASALRDRLSIRACGIISWDPSGQNRGQWMRERKHFISPLHDISEDLSCLGGDGLL